MKLTEPEWREYRINQDINDLLDRVLEAGGEVTLRKTIYGFNRVRAWRYAEVEGGRHDLFAILKTMGIREPHIKLVISNQEITRGLLVFYSPEGRCVRTKHFDDYDKVIKLINHE